MIQLGKTYKDHVTGFTGICTAKIEYITGCIHWEIQPVGVDKDGKTFPSQWFDAVRLDPESKILEGDLGNAKLGGPAPTSGGQTNY